MKVHFFASVLFIYERCSATFVDDIELNPSFGVNLPNQSLTLMDIDEIERGSYPVHRYKRQGNLC